MLTQLAHGPHSRIQKITHNPKSLMGLCDRKSGKRVLVGGYVQADCPRKSSSQSGSVQPPPPLWSKTKTGSPPFAARGTLSGTIGFSKPLYNGNNTLPHPEGLSEVACLKYLHLGRSQPLFISSHFFPIRFVFPKSPNTSAQILLF